jgi:transcription termination factor Rho
MSFPPKSNSDDIGDAKSGAKPRATKRAPRGPVAKRPRTRKTKLEKDADDSSASSQTTGELFPVTPQEKPVSSPEPQPVREAPAPQRAPEPSRPEPAPEAPAQVSYQHRSDETQEPPVVREVFVPAQHESSPSESVPAPEASQTSTPSEAAPSPAQPASEASSSPDQQQPSSEEQAQQPQQYQPQGQQQGGGGDRPYTKDRNYWKQLKKDKKKWKQQRQGGGGGGGGYQPHHQQPQYPQQPPPPNFTQSFGDLPDPSHFNDVAAMDNFAANLVAEAQGPVIYIDELYGLPLAELAAFARANGVTIEGLVPPRRLLLSKILEAATVAKRPLRDRGWLDLTDKGYGFIVHKNVNYRLYPENSFVPESLIKRFGLKRGHEIEALVQSPQGQERCPSAIRIESAMGAAPELLAKVTPFEELIPYYPLRRILVEAPEVHVKDVSMRAVDILTPIGFGQRGLIVAPPRTGKTVLLHNIANSVSANYPEAKLIILLVDERPEEVTDFKRHTKGEIVASTFDEMPENHVHAAEMVSEKAKRLVEKGEHVVILLDSITRLARAYNALASNSGKIMSGGLEATALQKPKRFFGAARNIEGAGSLTILGTALIDTGSRMDEIIFEEFKGTGNMELHLDRGLSDKRIFPAINIDRSGTRKEELIYHPEEMQRIYSLRRAMQGLGPIESMDMLIQRLKKTSTNAEFLVGLSRT